MQSADSLSLSKTGPADTVKLQKNSIPLHHNRQYRCFPFLMMLSMTLAICHFVLMNKFLSAYYGIISAGSFFIPFWAVLDDVIAEVYGFRISVRAFWFIFVSLMISQLIFYVITELSSPNLQANLDYRFVLQEMASAPLIIYLYIASYIAIWINSFLLVKWKIILNGKYFWLRSLASTIPCDILFLVMICPSWVKLGPAANLKEAIILTSVSFVFRIFIYLLLAYPSTLLVNLLKVIEGIDSYEVATLNPFSQFKKIRA